MKALGLGAGALCVVLGCGGGGGEPMPGGVDDGGDAGDDADDGPGQSARCEESRVGPPMLRRLTRAELAATLHDVFPQLDPQQAVVALGPDPVSSLGFDNDARVLVVGEQAAAEWLTTAETVADLVTEPAMLPQILPCATQGGTGCALELVERHGARLFHRPLDDAERSRYIEHFESVATRSDFPTAIRWTVVALLMSPHAVYRSEVGVEDGGERELAPWEVATALAFGFSGRPPSDQLMADAQAGLLDTPEQRTEAARALLRTEGGRAVVHDFVAQWVGYEAVATKTRNGVDAFDQAKGSMVDETHALVDEVLFGEDGDVRDLLVTPETVLDQTLVDFYGWGQVGRSARPEHWGRGLLAQGSVLATHAHADASSPTLRGLFVYERLLCASRPAVPDDIPPIDPPQPGVTTTRDRYETLHAAAPACAACHDAFDPIGFGFEHFDAVGRYRADENGLTIDTRSVLPLGGDSEPIAFDGIDELAVALADADNVTDCVSGLTAAYVFGGAGGQTCLAESARDQLVAGEIGLVDYIAELAAAPHFTRRAMP